VSVILLIEMRDELNCFYSWIVIIVPSTVGLCTNLYGVSRNYRLYLSRV